MRNNTVLLINPSINTKTQKKFVTDIIRATFPFSLGHLGGYLLNKGFSVKVVDDQISFLEDDDLEQLISEIENPKIIGITTLTATCARVYDLADKIKNIAPDATVVLGGIHATTIPEECLSHKSVDVVVRGEGEITFSKLIENIINEQDYRHINGISFCKNDEFIHNQDMPLINDLNTLPDFPYFLFESDIDKYPGFYSIQTSRGCPYGCTFCSQRSITGRSYRYVSPERALRDIEILIDKYGATVIRLMDDNIAANKKHLMRLLNAIIEKGLNKKVSFEAPMRGDNINENVLDKLKEANFSFLTYGLETTSENLMKEIDKGETVKDIINAIKMTAQKGMAVGTTLIFGLPNETRKDRWNAIKTVSSLPLASVRFNILTPYPGTPIYYVLLKKKQLLIKKDWENFSVQYMWAGDDIPYVPEGVDKYELMFSTMLANLWFYLRPSGIWKMLTQSAAGGNVILLKKKWYFSRFLFKISRVGFYLTKRFVVVFTKMMFTQFKLLPAITLHIKD